MQATGFRLQASGKHLAEDAGSRVHDFISGAAVQSRCMTNIAAISARVSESEDVMPVAWERPKGATTMKSSKNADPAHDVLGYERQPLDAIFRPETVAVIGATDRPGSVGRTIMWNLITNPFGGTVFPVNSRRQNVLGIKAYPSVSEVPAKVDLAVIVAPAPTVPEIIARVRRGRRRGRHHHLCRLQGDGARRRGARGAGPRGGPRGARMRIIGPNCLGVMNPPHRPQRHLRRGHGPARQRRLPEPERGALTAILDRSFRENVGFSALRQRRLHDGRRAGGI